MPESIAPYGISLPIAGEIAPQGIPSQLRAMVESFHHKLVGVATDDADRDAKYATVPAGSLVVSWQQRTLWVKSDTAWITLFEDTLWQTTGFEAKPNWSLNGCKWRRLGGIVNVRFQLSYQGTADIGSESTASPYLGEIEISAQTTLKARPDTAETSMWQGATHGSCYLSASGSLMLTTIAGNSRIKQGDGITACFTFAGRD